MKWMHRFTPNLVQHIKIAMDRGCKRLHSKHTASLETGPAVYMLKLPEVCFDSRAPHCGTVFQNGQDNTTKASHHVRLIMKYSLWLPQDTQPLESCSVKRKEILLKGYLSMKCHTKISRCHFRTVPPRVNGDDLDHTVPDLDTIILLVLLWFSLIPYRSHHSLTLVRSRFRATETLLSEDGTTATNVELSA